jgi:hypothetical protein
MDVRRAMTAHAYCTYFDHRYLGRALSMFASLRRHDPSARLWVLCLSEECLDILEALALPGLRTVALHELESADPELAASRPTRSLIEYYFTCSPCLPRFVLSQDPEVEIVTYLDSDLYFFASPQHLLQEFGQGSVAITPHRFTPRTRRSHGRFGEYNVGWLSFRRDAPGLACLEWWRQSCLAWCHDRVEGDRYADQKYLEQFGLRFPRVCALKHPGANLAPWNIAGCDVALADGVVSVDGAPLVFFHFQGLKRLNDGAYDSNLTGYGARMTPAVRDGIFRPYLAELERVERDIGPRLAAIPDRNGIRRQAGGLVGRLRALSGAIKLAHARRVGNVVRP